MLTVQQRPEHLPAIITSPVKGPSQWRSTRLTCRRMYPLSPDLLWVHVEWGMTNAWRTFSLPLFENKWITMHRKTVFETLKSTLNKAMGGAVWISVYLRDKKVLRSKHWLGIVTRPILSFPAEDTFSMAMEGESHSFTFSLPNSMLSWTMLFLLFFPNTLKAHPQSARPSPSWGLLTTPP